MKKIPIIIISGPTASGKTALGITVAKYLGTEIISADSMQIYKGMAIATAQPDENELREVNHRLIGFLEPTDSFSVSDFCDAAKKEIDILYSNGKIPVIVGGTGLYLNSLCDDITFSMCGDTEIRERLKSEAEENGIDALYERLIAVDPISAKKIEKNNKRRVIRALEVYEVTGKPFSQVSEESKPEVSRYDTLWFNITFSDREVLYKRINDRVDKMFERGLLEEARALEDRLKASGAAQAIGHKELYPYLDGKISLEEATQNLKTATRHYAKRQITWFKKRENTVELFRDTENIEEKALRIIEEWKCKL